MSRGQLREVFDTLFSASIGHARERQERARQGVRVLPKPEPRPLGEEAQQQLTLLQALLDEQIAAPEGVRRQRAADRTEKQFEELLASRRKKRQSPAPDHINPLVDATFEAAKKIAEARKLAGQDQSPEDFAITLIFEHDVDLFEQWAMLHRWGPEERISLLEQAEQLIRNG